MPQPKKATAGQQKRRTAATPDHQVPGSCCEARWSTDADATGDR